MGFAFSSAWAEPDVKFSGQFRINSYSESRGNSGDFGDGPVEANRLRFRPTWDAAFDDGVALHMQFNIGHIREGIGNHPLRQDASGGTTETPSFGLRHGYLKAELSDSITGMAGIVPLSDRFGDTLFSSTWDFNPIALAFLGKSGNLDWRLAVAKIQENSEADKTAGVDSKNDINVYLADVDSGGFGGSIYYLASEKDNVTLGETTLTILGVRWAGELGPARVNAFLMNSNLDMKTAKVKSNGYAAKVESLFSVGDDSGAGIMFLYTSGDKDFGSTTKNAGSFYAPMTAVGTRGYWGYTGKLNIQQPTDTGIDGDQINIDNAGAGLMTIQAKYSTPLADKLDGYVAVGFYQAQDVASGASKDIGTELYAQGSYNLGSNLNLDFGIDYVMLGKGHSELYNGVSKSRAVTLFFSRLQLEW